MKFNEESNRKKMNKTKMKKNETFSTDWMKFAGKCTLIMIASVSLAAAAAACSNCKHFICFMNKNLSFLLFHLNWCLHKVTAQAEIESKKTMEMRSLHFMQFLYQIAKSTNFSAWRKLFSIVFDFRAK